MKKIIVVALLITSAPLLGALQQYAGKSFTPNTNVTPSYKFNVPTYNTNYKFNQNVTPITDYRNYSSFDQQPTSTYTSFSSKPTLSSKQVEQAKQLMSQQPSTTSNMMKKYATARSYSTSSTQQDGNSWWDQLLAWLGIGATVWYTTKKDREIKKEKELVKKTIVSIMQEDSTSGEYYSSSRKNLQKAQEVKDKK